MALVSLVCGGLTFVAAIGAQGPAVAEEADAPRVLVEERPETPAPSVEEQTEPPEDSSVASEPSAASEGDGTTEVPQASGDAAEATGQPPAVEGREPEEALVPEAMHSIVQVVVMGAGDEIRRTGSGFVVQTNHVVTAAHVVEDEDRISVVVPSEGAPSPMLVARVGAVEEYADLALLVVGGLELEPLVLANDGFDVGRNVVSAGFWNTAETRDGPGVAIRSTVGEHRALPATRDDAAVALLRHNSMIPAAGYGGPVLNDCGEVVGVNRGSPETSRRALRRGQAPQDVVYAAGVTAIVGLLQPAGVTFTRTESSCQDRVAMAQAEAERTAEEKRQKEAEVAAKQAELDQAREEREEQETKVAAKQAELDQAREEEKTANERVAELERQLKEAEETGAEGTESLRAELEEARGKQVAVRQVVEDLEAQVEKGQQNLAITIVIAVAALLLLAIVGGVFYRRRSLELAYARQQAAAAGRRHAHGDRVRLGEAGGLDGPDYLLTGETGDGNAVSLKVTGDMVANGVVIGRSPRNALLLIDDKTLSREHARLFEGHDGVLNIEDLGTTNGTRVNGRRLQRGRGESLRSGDTLQLGEVTLRLTRNG